MSHLSFCSEASLESFILRCLPYIESGIRPYLRRYPGQGDEFRSAAQLKLVTAAPGAMASPNPVGYMLIAITNAFKVVERGYLRERRRWNACTLDDVSLASFVPAPELFAMAREEIALRALPHPKAVGHDIKAHEWLIFRAIVADHPCWKNREIADAFNRLTGRKLNQFSVSMHRRRMGI